MFSFVKKVPGLPPQGQKESGHNVATKRAAWLPAAPWPKATLLPTHIYLGMVSTSAQQQGPQARIHSTDATS